MSICPGKGGQLTSARWHTRGRPIVYLTSNPAAALLEVLVHEMPIYRVSRHYQWLEIQTDDDVNIAATPALHSDWRANVVLTRSIGDRWLRGGRRHSWKSRRCWCQRLRTI